VFAECTRIHAKDLDYSFEDIVPAFGAKSRYFSPSSSVISTFRSRTDHP